MIKMFLMITLLNFNEQIKPSSVYKYCKEQRIKCPDIVTAQAVLETGWFKCTNCSLSKNNLFGLWYDGSYKEFSSWKESVRYYKTWQLGRYSGEKNYYNFLACVGIDNDGNCQRYAEDMDAYIKLLKSIVKDYSHEWKT